MVQKMDVENLLQTIKLVSKKVALKRTIDIK